MWTSGDVSTLRIMRVVLSCISCIDHVVAVVTEGIGLNENKIMRYEDGHMVADNARIYVHRFAFRNFTA